MSFLFAPPAQAVIPVDDERGDLFPVRRVYGIARNYGKRDSDGRLDPALIFMKPADNIVAVAPGACARIVMPEAVDSMVHEIELVACLSKGGSNLTVEEAQAAVWGWCVGIDFTRRDLRVKDAPWEAAKAFDGSAPVSYVRPKSQIGVPQAAPIWLDVNGERRQDGRTDQMLRGVFEIISEISRVWTLAPGDVIFTGTPAGNDPCRVGDLLEGGVEGVGSIRCEILPRT